MVIQVSAGVGTDNCLDNLKLLLEAVNSVFCVSCDSKMGKTNPMNFELNNLLVMREYKASFALHN